MKVESLSIRNFKRFDRLDVSFTPEGLREVSNRFLILGDNGAGKTTLLQAIALPLAIAMGQVRGVAEFQWIGFLPGRFGRWGKPPIEPGHSEAVNDLIGEEHTYRLPGGTPAWPPERVPTPSFCAEAG